MSATPIIAEHVPVINLEKLSKLDPFRDLSDAVLNGVADITEQRVYQCGETIFAMGQFDGSEFYVIVDGELKVSQLDPATGAMLFDHYKAGEMFGLANAVAPNTDGVSERLTLSAETALTLYAVEAESFRQLAQQKPTLTRSLMLHFAAQISKRQDQAVETDATPERRVYATLIGLVARDAVTGSWKIDRMPKHRELAEEADVEEAIAAQAIAQLIQDGLARRDYPGLVIEDMTQLSRLAS